MDSQISSDLSSQQILVNQLRERLQQNESVLKGRESEFTELQSKFNKLKFLHKSKTSTASSESTPTKSGSFTDDKMTTSSDMSPHLTGEDRGNRGKLLLLKKQLDESRALLQTQETENHSMRRELQVLKDKQIKYEEESDDKDVEVITGGEGVNEMFAQIVYKDTKIVEMNQKICELETRIMDLQESHREQNEVLQARNRAIKVLLAQQQTVGAMNVSFDEVVQREEEKERIEKLKERVCELEMEKGSLQLRLMEVEGTNGSKPPVFDIELERDSLRAERDELKIRFDELMAKCDSLELQKDKVVNDKERVVNELKKLKEINNNLSKDRDKQKSDIERLNDFITNTKHDFNSVNHELNELKSQINGKDNEIQFVRQQLSDLAMKSKNIIAEKDSFINDLKQQLDQKSDDIPTEKDKQIEELVKELENIKNENWSLVNINEENKVQSNELEERLKAIQTEYESQKSNFNQLFADKEIIKTERQSLVQQFNDHILVLRNENSELRSQLDTSASHVSHLLHQLTEISVKSEEQNCEHLLETENLNIINSDLETKYNERVTQLEESVKTFNEELSDLLNDKNILSEELETLKTSLETEKQLKVEALELLDKIQSEKYAENDLFEEKDKQIDNLRQELKKYETLISEQNIQIDGLNREQEDSKSYIKDLEIDFEEKFKTFNELEFNYSENKRLLKNKIELIDEMNEEKQELETKFEEAKDKNQTLAKQMENLIKIVEIEGQEKERLKQSLENLQKENFEENDLIREKDQRIENLQKEIRKQVEDMQEIEELLNEKQNEIEVLNNDIIVVQKERTEFENRFEEIQKRVQTIDSSKNGEIMALMRQIEDLNEENDCNKNEIKALNQKLTNDLKFAKERFDSREEENLSTIQELRKQLESQEIRLNEAMSELMSKSDENTDTNLLHNDIQVLRETIASLQQQNQLLQNDFHNSVSQLNSSVVEYKSLLEESRIQIDRLEAQKLSAVQETNKVNQVLESERENQSIVVNENQELRQRLTQLEFELQTINSQNQYEYESLQNDRINQLNQTIDDLKKHNSELIQNSDQLKQFSEEIQNSSSKQLEELKQKSDNERSQLNQRLIEFQSTVESLSADKQSYEYGFYDLQNKYQELDRLLQNKNIEIENHKQMEDSFKKLSITMNNLKEEKEQLLSVLAEKEKLIQEKQEMEQSFRDNEHNFSEFNSKIQSLNELNANLQNSCESFVGIEDKLKARITELEQEMSESKRIQSENESKTSETEYELDILKRNYTIEMDSFGAQVQERENLIEKLQTINEKLKRKADKYENLVKDFTEKECYYKSKLEESHGLVKYEQMQRQTATDSRIFELQQKLAEKDSYIQMEVMALKTENANFVALEQELKRKIHELEENKSRTMSGNTGEQELNNYRSHIESLTNQLEAERNEKRRLQELFQTNGDQNGDQLTQLMAQMETERQTQIAQRHELELKCKKFAAKFKVKDREVNALEEKLRIAKENASKNVNEEELIESNKRIEELNKRVEDLQFTASNLDSALQTERHKRRQLETEKQTFWSQSNQSNELKSKESDAPLGSSSFSLLIDEGNGDKSGLNSAKRFITKQKHYLLRGPPNAKYKRIALVVYLVVIHVLFVKACLF